MLTRRANVGFQAVQAVVTAWLCLFAISGCGSALYEERLDNTKRLFAHMELLNAHLHRDWVDPETAVRLRVPNQYLMIAPPAKPEASAGGTSPGAGERSGGPTVIVDDRQPKYLNIELPGLRGAFFAPLGVVGAKAGDAEQYGYIYVLTNHHLFASVDKARDFGKDVVKLLADALQVGVESEDKWAKEKYPPRVGTFVQPVEYKAVVLSPSKTINGAEVQFSFYIREQGDIQVVVLFMLPKDVVVSERLTDRIPLCLETLQVTGDKLARPTVAAPSTGPASGF